MPTLEEMRRWMRGEDVEGLPNRCGVWDDNKGMKIKIGDKTIGEVKDFGDNTHIQGMRGGKKQFLETLKERHKKNKKGRSNQHRYKISSDGSDAILRFGKYKDHLVSDLILADLSYLEWIVKNNFPEDLKDVIRKQIILWFVKEEKKFGTSSFRTAMDKKCNELGIESFKITENLNDIKAEFATHCDEFGVKKFDIHERDDSTIVVEFLPKIDESFYVENLTIVLEGWFNRRVPMGIKVIFEQLPYF